MADIVEVPLDAPEVQEPEPEPEPEIQEHVEEIAEEIPESEANKENTPPKKRGRPPGTKNKEKPIKTVAPKAAPKPKTAPKPKAKPKARTTTSYEGGDWEEDEEAPRGFDRNQLAAEVLALLQEQRHGQVLRRRNHYNSWFQNHAIR